MREILCRISCSLVLAVLVICSGCRACQLRNDQDRIRNAVLEMHTNQIMDNLIRLRQGLPIVHLDYIHMTGTVTQNANGNFSGGQTTVNTSNRAATVPAANSLIAASRVFTNSFGYGTSGSQTNQLTITAEPVMSSPDVYHAYLRFLDNEEHLVCTDTPPLAGEAIVVRCVEVDSGECNWRGKCIKSKQYYWIPSGFQDDFRALSLRVVALRGDVAAAISTFDVTILGTCVNPHCSADGSPCYVKHEPGSPIAEIRVKLDKRIPNDDGFIEANVGRHVISSSDGLTVVVNDDPDLKPAVSGQPVGGNQKTDEIYVILNVVELGVAHDETDENYDVAIEKVIEDLQGQKVKIHLQHFIPSGSQTEILLDNLRTQLELQRLGQFQ